eukprot:c8813_g1_i3.p1 GENE.c8813_g1_i3~~c8813_g1_i3.p1  ORF type:complete len:542 (-),score=96.95 c8813_g1_i3:135-1760(-)
MIDGKVCCAITTVLQQTTTPRVKTWVTLLFGALVLIAAVDMDLMTNHGSSAPHPSDWAFWLWTLGLLAFVPAHSYLTMGFLYTWGWAGIRNIPHLINTNQRVTGRVVWFTAVHIAIILISVVFTGREMPLVVSALLVGPGICVGTMVSRRWMPLIAIACSFILLVTSFAMYDHSLASSHTFNPMAASIASDLSQFIGSQSRQHDSSSDPFAEDSPLAKAAQASPALLIIPITCVCFSTFSQLTVFVSGLFCAASVFFRLCRRYPPHKQPLMSALLAAFCFSLILLSALATSRLHGLAVALVGCVGMFLSILRLEPKYCADHLCSFFCLRMCYFANAIQNDLLLFIMAVCCAASSFGFLKISQISSSTSPTSRDNSTSSQMARGVPHTSNQSQWPPAVSPHRSLLTSLTFSFVVHPLHTPSYCIGLVLSAAPLNSVFLAAIGTLGALLSLVHLALSRDHIRLAQFIIIFASAGVLFTCFGMLWNDYREHVISSFVGLLPETLRPGLVLYFWQVTRGEMAREIAEAWCWVYGVAARVGMVWWR